MQINEKLNFVIPLYDGNDQVYAYVHSMPLSREVFEINYLLLSKTFAAIHGEGLGEVAGPRVAALVLRDVAKRMAGEIGSGLEVPLLNEIHRLTSVLLQSPAGWQPIPFDDCVRGNQLEPEDIAEVENALVFFIAMSAMHRKKMLQVILPGAAQLWGAQTSSLSCTEFAKSLRTLIETDASGTVVKLSSLPT